MDLSKKIKEIRKFSRFGLIKFSEHCCKRCSERCVSQKDIITMLCDNHNSIVQNHNKYKGNKYPTFVVWTKNTTNKKYYHIVVQDQLSEFGGHIYTVQTVYEPSNQYFDNNGRYVKPKKKRELANSHY